MKNRFVLAESELKPNHWVCTDTENLIICTFEYKNFNNSQDFKLISDLNPNPSQLARFTREMGDWLVVNHPGLLF